jgi:hypothetical protein
MRMPMSPAQRNRVQTLFQPGRTGTEALCGLSLIQRAPERFRCKAAAVIERTGLGKDSLEAFDMVANYVAT